jgi:hypothetical protein
MAYELRVSGRVEGRYDTSDEAEARARAVLQGNADSVVEVIDLATGKPYAPAASAADREDLAGKIGY